LESFTNSAFDQKFSPAKKKEDVLLQRVGDCLSLSSPVKKSIAPQIRRKLVSLPGIVIASFPILFLKKSMMTIHSNLGE
jgi:hypothetical protein